MINNSLFKLEEIPKFHPISQSYERIRFWKEQIRRCIEGYWIGGKWMPPELYYYINFHHITMEKGIYRGISLPWCRDIDWEKAYIYSEATGFSGFELDKEYSCNRFLIDPLYTDTDLKRLCYNGTDVDKGFYNNLFKEDGTRKTYVQAKDYMQKIFPQSMGKPSYYNSAKHVMEMAARGYGKSYFSSGLIGQNFLFGGARDYDMYLELKKQGNPLKTETVVGAIDTKYSSKLTDKVKTAFDKLPGKEIITIDGEKRVFPSPLSLTCEGSFSVGKTYKATYSGSQIQHVTFADNPLAANGGRPNRIFIDEVGFMDNILETWEAIESTQANEAFKRLTIYAMGTGGLTKSGAVTYVKDIFYDPETYNCVVFDDEWENKGKICYFVPTIKASNEFKEGPNFITNEDKALASVVREREKAKKARSQTKYLGLVINKPIAPSEIFLTMEGNFFPVQELKEILAELEVNKILLDSSWKVDLTLSSSGNVVTKHSVKIPIRDFPLTKNVNLDAAIEIFEKPKKDINGQVFPDRYYAATDPVDDDGNDDIKRSLQSTFIYDSWVDRIVAEYTARTYLASEYYENVRKLLLYYNAKNLYENNKKGMYGHFKNKVSLNLLAETPEILKEQNLVKSTGIGNKSLGVNMSNDKIKLYAIELLKEWLDKPAYGKENLKNMHTLRSPALLNELISYRIDLNADRVSALLVLMMFIEENKRIIEASKKEGTTHQEKKDSDFWKRAYSSQSYNIHKVYNQRGILVN